jgi:ABC-2 type transport system ATP-binding protein
MAKMQGEAYVRGSSRERLFKPQDYQKATAAVNALKDLSIEIPRTRSLGSWAQMAPARARPSNCLLGLLKPTAGSGTIFGLDIIKNSPEIRRRVGYLSQTPRFYDRMTAREVLRFTARFF